MTTKEIAIRHSYARAMLERGCRVASVATMLSAKFQVSRSTASCVGGLGRFRYWYHGCSKICCCVELDEWLGFIFSKFTFVEVVL